MVNSHRARAVVLAGVLVALVAAVGCSVNPATGNRQLALIGEAQEIQMGRSADGEIVEQMGLYPDEELQRYLQELGSALAASSERPHLPWQFRVVDDPVVNAFALPGGFIYVTRGMLAHVNSEAELAGVLGHEIGHVTARHSVEQISRQQLAGVTLGAAMILSEEAREYGGLLGTSFGLLFLKFGRDDERQSDELGLRYLARGGYDPQEMSKVFVTLGRVSELEGGGRIPGWLSTHPDPGNRAQQIAAQAAQLPQEQQEGTVNRASYLGRIKGLTFGEDPREGYTVANAFYHPGLRFQLRFPNEWNVANRRTAVGAVSPEKDAVAVLTFAEGSPEAAARSFFEQEGIERGTQRRDFFQFRTTPTEGQPTVRGLVGFRQHGDNTYRLLGYTSAEGWAQHERILQQCLSTFARLDDQRYLEVAPKRLEVVEVERETTLRALAQRRSATVEIDQLAVINGLRGDEPLAAGSLVKLVVGGDLPRQ